MTDLRQHQRDVRTYLIGFGLAVVLTVIPFVITATGGLSRTWFDLAILFAAIVQVLVHLRYFLHINLRHTPRENLLALGFTGLLMVIMIGGTLWIMGNLAARMMGT